MNICVNCAFVRYVPDPNHKDDKRHRLDFRCGAVCHDISIDPVTGEECFLTHESHWHTEYKNPSCTDMNPEGNCPLFQEK